MKKEGVYLAGWLRLLHFHPELNVESNLQRITMSSSSRRISPGGREPQHIGDSWVVEIPRDLVRGGDEDIQSEPRAFARGILEAHGRVWATQGIPYVSIFAMPIIEKRWEGVWERKTSDGFLIFRGIGAVDFLSDLYDESTPRSRSRDFYAKYLDIIGGGPQGVPTARFVRCREDAITPTKLRASDEGYDLTVVDIYKRLSPRTALFETGIKVIPPHGFYFEIVPRSSISKSGYVLSNSVGIIDRGFRGTLKVALTRIDPDIPEPILPFRCAQLLLKRATHYLMEEAETVDSTQRGEGEFGSSGGVANEA